MNMMTSPALEKGGKSEWVVARTTIQQSWYTQVFRDADSPSPSPGRGN
jgi:hypothetical protein